MQDSISMSDTSKVSLVCRSPSLTADLGYYTLIPSHIQTTHTSQTGNKYITSMKELSSMCSKSTVTSLKQQYNINYFDKLTDDLLIKIFSFLTTYELCSSCFLVSRRWYCLCLDSSLWKSLVINTEKCHHLNIDRGLTTILRLLSREVQPNSCELAYNSYSSNDTLVTNSLNGSNLSNLPIQTITLNGCSLLTDKSLILIARKCAFKLRSLELRACSQIFTGLNKILLKCVNLEKLDISGCTNITLNTLQQPEHSSKIRYLDLSDCHQLDSNTLKIMLKFYGQKLIHLYLRRNTLLTDQSIKYVTTYCPLLKELSVSYCPQLTDLVCYELSVELNSKLKYLSLAKCEQITDSGLKQIARNCNKLRYLNIRGCEEISDEGIIELTRGCGARLKSLDLGKCNISDNGLTALSENCPNLRKLSVKDCFLISDAGIMLLSYYCRGLIHLNIGNCDRVSIDAYHYVKKICRRCVIHHTNPHFS